MRIDFFAITIGTNLTTLASSGLEISCPASGFPKPTIQWYREGVPVEPSMMLNVDEDTGTLFTMSISYRKRGTFACKASNALGSVSASSFISVLGKKLIFSSLLRWKWVFASNRTCFKSILQKPRQEILHVLTFNKHCWLGRKFVSDFVNSEHTLFL